MRRLLSVVTLLLITIQYTAAQNISYTNNIKPLFDKYGCTSCHGGNGNLFVTPYANLFITGDHKPDVVKGDTNSVIILKIKGTAGFGSQMPEGGPVMASNDLKLIVQWIKNGAPENTTSIDILNSTALAPSFNLAQNYPNPFNPSTTITFDLAQTNYVTITVFDLQGKTISNIVSDVYPAGRYSVKWNAINLPSGIYFYRMNAGSFVQTRKLILLK